MLKEGTVLIQEKIVSENETAAKIASGGIEVFSTPMLIAFMENTAFNLAQTEMAEGETTVGIEINVKHLKANLPGDKVICEAVLEKIEGKKLFFTIVVTSDGETAGKGTHTRYIVNEKKFVEKLKKKKDR